MKRSYLLSALVCLVAAYNIQAQTNDTSVSAKTQPFQFVEQMPEYPGGQQALMAYISQNIKYPLYEHENDIQGTVYVQFVVNETGHIEDIKIRNSPSQNMSDEVIRVLKTMPAWKPGMQKNIAVKVEYILPVKFQLTDKEKKKHKQRT